MLRTLFLHWMTLQGCHQCTSSESAVTFYRKRATTEKLVSPVPAKAA